MINFHGNCLSFCLLCPDDNGKYLILQEKSRILLILTVLLDLAWLWEHLPRASCTCSCPYCDSGWCRSARKIITQLTTQFYHPTPLTSDLSECGAKEREIVLRSIMMLVEHYKIIKYNPSVGVTEPANILNQREPPRQIEWGNSLVIRGGSTIGIILSSTHSIATSICHLSPR